MSADNAKSFGGTIGKTVKESKPWWPTPRGRLRQARRRLERAAINGECFLERVGREV